jgi:hypothetical protein
MRRRSLVALVLLVVVGSFVALRRSSAPPDTSPYHASSADLIGATGRPQLLEFFHKA